MIGRRSLSLYVAALCLALVAKTGAEVQYLSPQPLSKAVKASTGKVSSKGPVMVPMITWGGDVATVLADMGGAFKDEGLDVKLFREDNFAQQVDMCIAGKTPYLRGTMGMITAAADAMKAKGIELVVIYQLTWSRGGDAMVVRNKKNLKNIKTVALQLYGPHMDYAANLFNSAGRLKQVQFKWLKELTFPTYDTKGKTVDPVSAFLNDKSLDAVMCIIPDALALTSNGKVGTGAEGSVKGATILLSTKTASRIIADVYAVRKDYFDAHKDQVRKFTHALFRGEEALRTLLKAKSSQQAQYRQLLSKSADLLLGASQATADVEALMGDCEFVGFSGNVSFFTGKGTTRDLENLTKEIQSSFSSMGLITTKPPIGSAGWDYSQMAQGLKYASAVPAAPKKQFDTKKVTKKIEKQIAVEPTTWEEEGTLFKVEITFEPNQSDFPQAQYAQYFSKAMNIAQTYAGALIVIEGHSDPLGVLKAKQKGEQQQVIAQMTQTAKNLSYERAQAVRSSFLSFCKKQNVLIDESQFVPVGLGITSPKFSPPTTKDEWAANRRVVFRIKQVEAELTEFVPL